MSIDQQRKKILVIVSPDKLGRFFLEIAPQHENLIYAYDMSSNYRRILKLIFRGVISVFALFKMLWAEYFREELEIKVIPNEIVYNNSDLRNIIKKRNVNRVFLFRAGLIISKDTLREDVNFFNVHCAKVPDYAGIGVLFRALRDRSFEQEATLHQVTETIDGGKVISVEPYTMRAENSYGKNEDIAYKAGANLLVKSLLKSI